MLSKKTTIEDFILRASKIHNNKFDYSLITEIKNNHTKIPIICPLHGVWEVSTNVHLRGSNCPVCARDPEILRNINKNKWYYKCHKLFGNKFDYSKVKYIDSHTPVEIICPDHGSMMIRPYVHTSNKHGCEKCSRIRSQEYRDKFLSQFLEKSKNLFGETYDYSLITEYKNAKHKMPVVCRIHGIFHVNSNMHTSGNGCPKCGLLTGGWTKTDFKNNCKDGKGILYLLNFYNEKESFIKIGITSKSVKKRYRRDCPYEYEIIKELKLYSDVVYNTEKQILRDFNSFKYQPLISFAGETECFNISAKDEILSYLNQLNNE